jgi:hypothetical protein
MWCHQDDSAPMPRCSYSQTTIHFHAPKSSRARRTQPGCRQDTSRARGLICAHARRAPRQSPNRLRVDSFAHANPVWRYGAGTARACSYRRCASDGLAVAPYSPATLRVALRMSRDIPAATHRW